MGGDYKFPPITLVVPPSSYIIEYSNFAHL
jgi:hypothetical protein